MGRLMGRNEGCFSYQLGHKNGQIVRWKDFGSGSWGLQPPLFAAPRPKPSVGTPAGRVQDQDQDQDDEQEIVRSPSQPILVSQISISLLAIYWWQWGHFYSECMAICIKLWKAKMFTDNLILCIQGRYWFSIYNRTNLQDNHWHWFVSTSYFLLYKRC